MVAVVAVVTLTRLVVIASCRGLCPRRLLRRRSPPQRAARALWRVRRRRCCCQAATPSTASRGGAACARRRLECRRGAAVRGSGADSPLRIASARGFDVMNQHCVGNRSVSIANGGCNVPPRCDQYGSLVTDTIVCSVPATIVPCVAGVPRTGSVVRRRFASRVYPFPSSSAPLLASADARRGYSPSCLRNRRAASMPFRKSARGASC
jgi:hypothetical protein